MKRWVKILLWIAGLLLGLLILVVVLIVNCAPEAIRRVGETVGSQRLGAAVSIGAVDIGWTAQSVALRDVVISNPPAFGAGRMLELPELLVRGGANGGLAELRLNLASVSVIIDQKGRTNWTLGGVTMGGAKGSKGAAPEFPHIDRLVLNLGAVRYEDRRSGADPVLINLGIHDRVLTNVSSLNDFTPLAAEILLRGAFGGFGGKR